MNLKSKESFKKKIPGFEFCVNFYLDEKRFEKANACKRP